MSTAMQSSHWCAVCDSAAIIPNTGVCVKVDDQQVALFRLRQGEQEEWYAIDNRCPFAGAYVLSRGILGSHGEAPTVASPIYKQRFDLRDGSCLDNDDVRLATWPVRVEQGQVYLGVAG